jgi:hypothetical protein
MRKLPAVVANRVQSLADMEVMTKEAALELLVNLGWRQYLDTRVALANPGLWARIKAAE